LKVPARAFLFSKFCSAKIIDSTIMELSEEYCNYGPVAQPGHQTGGAIEHLTFILNRV